MVLNEYIRWLRIYLQVSEIFPTQTSHGQGRFHQKTKLSQATSVYCVALEPQRLSAVNSTVVF
jgi:hypothetical protein